MVLLACSVVLLMCITVLLACSGALLACNRALLACSFAPGPPKPVGPLAGRQVLDRVRRVAEAKGRHLGYALDTKGPEIRTAMLRGGKDIMLEEGELGADVTTVGERVSCSCDCWGGTADISLTAPPERATGCLGGARA
jgi:hypothetical protein